MRIKTGSRKQLKSKRCRKKPIDNFKDVEDVCRMDDGASKAYKKLGRSGFECYAKDKAQTWLDMPPTVQVSGLFMETSKNRIRGGPISDKEDDLMIQGYPQPHYTLKILRTAYKIYRIRLEKYYFRKIDKKNTSIWFWSDKKRNEEPKWAYIIDRPLIEQYVLMLQYIRDLGAKLAFQMGHKEVITSATPFRAMEKLHPLKHLDFRKAKHFLPKPFITSSDSDIQLKINREVDKLDTAVTKADLKKSEFTEYTAATTSSSSEDSFESDEDEARNDRRDNYIAGHKFSRLFDREGENYVSYRDPESDESIFTPLHDIFDKEGESADYYNELMLALFEYEDSDEEEDSSEETFSKRKKSRKKSKKLPL